MSGGVGPRLNRAGVRLDARRGRRPGGLSPDARQRAAIVYKSRDAEISNAPTTVERDGDASPTPSDGLR